MSWECILLGKNCPEVGTTGTGGNRHELPFMDRLSTETKEMIAALDTKTDETISVEELSKLQDAFVREGFPATALIVTNAIEGRLPDGDHEATAALNRQRVPLHLAVAQTLLESGELAKVPD